MAINAQLQNMISFTQSRVAFCHHATLAIAQFGRTGRIAVPSVNAAQSFGVYLQVLSRSNSPYDHKTAIPPHLYDIFAFVPPGRELIAHTAIVVDEDPGEVKVAECNNLVMEVQVNPLGKVLGRFRSFYPVLMQFSQPEVSLSLLFVDIAFRDSEIRF
ncbi:MAG TPA: hypothetical protein VMD02_07620 [Candidatus Omnitrophota bacterium]|nr:hypothetical protein [Candidatus Omnitrophota bacterium]